MRCIFCLEPLAWPYEICTICDAAKMKHRATGKVPDVHQRPEKFGECVVLDAFGPRLPTSAAFSAALDGS